MKVLDTIIEGTNPPNKKYRVLWVNPQDKKLRYFNKGVWEELDCMLGNTSNLDKYVGFYTQSNSATTVYPTNWPQLELYISDGKLMCTTGLFGGAVGMGEVELKYDEVNDVLIFEASEESPVFHNELGPIISNVYFKRLQNDSTLYAYSNIECTNTQLILTSYGGSITDYKLKMQ